MAGPPRSASRATARSSRARNAASGGASRAGAGPLAVTSRARWSCPRTRRSPGPGLAHRRDHQLGPRAAAAPAESRRADRRRRLDLVAGMALFPSGAAFARCSLREGPRYWLRFAEGAGRAVLTLAPTSPAAKARWGTSRARLRRHRSTRAGLGLRRTAFCSFATAPAALAVARSASCWPRRTVEGSDGSPPSARSTRPPVAPSGTASASRQPDLEVLHQAVVPSAARSGCRGSSRATRCSRPRLIHSTPTR